MPRFFVVLFACAFASFAFAENSLPQIHDALEALRGHPISAVVARLGEPDWKDLRADPKIYAWDGSRSQHDFWSNFSSCVVKVYVDASDKIVHFFYTGSDDPCAPYARKLAGRGAS